MYSNVTSYDFDIVYMVCLLVMSRRKSIFIGYIYSLVGLYYLYSFVYYILIRRVISSILRMAPLTPRWGGYENMSIFVCCVKSYRKRSVCGKRRGCVVSLNKLRTVSLGSNASYRYIS